MRRLLSVCALTALGLPPLATAARADVAYTHRDAIVCIDPRAVRAINNGADRRQPEPNWIVAVAQRGQCGTLPGGTPVTMMGEDGDLARIVASAGGRPGQLFISRTDLAPEPPARPHDPITEAARSAFAAPPASPGPLAASVSGGLPAPAPPPPQPAQAPWQFSASSEGLYTCQIASDTPQGRVALTAAAARPKVARLLLQHNSWAIPPGTLVHANLAFDGAAPLKLVGVGDGTDIAVDLTEVTLPLLMESLTTAAGGTVSFASVANESAWMLDLHGLAAAASAMAACVRDHHIDVPPPLGDAQPAGVAGLLAARPAARPGWAAQPGGHPVWARVARRPAAPPPQPLATTVTAQNPAPRPPQQPEGTRAYVGCLRSEARTGQYADGNTDHNALTVLSQCIPEWRKWMDECRKTNPGTGRDCTIDSIALAKIGLYASGKRTD